MTQPNPALLAHLARQNVTAATQDLWPTEPRNSTSVVPYAVEGVAGIASAVAACPMFPIVMPTHGGDDGINLSNALEIYGGVQLAPGQTYTLFSPVTGKDVMLAGAGPGRTMLDATRSIGGLQVSGSCVLRDFSLTGHGIAISDGTAQISNVSAPGLVFDRAHLVSVVLTV